MRLLRIEIDTDVSVWSEKGELAPADLRTDVGDALSATTLKLVLAELGEKIESGQHKGKIHAKSGELMGFWDWTREEDSGFGEAHSWPSKGVNRGTGCSSERVTA